MTMNHNNHINTYRPVVDSTVPVHYNKGEWSYMSYQPFATTISIHNYDPAISDGILTSSDNVIIIFINHIMIVSMPPVHQPVPPLEPTSHTL